MAVFRMLAFAVTALAASACATVDPPPDNLPGETIVYEPTYGPFCFDCTAIKITAATDGRVWVERRKRLGKFADWIHEDKERWSIRRELLMVTPAQLNTFRERLAPYRPAGRLIVGGNDSSGCATFWTDMPGTIVTWQNAGAEDVLIYDFGCDPGPHAGLREDLLAAPADLGITAPEQTWVATTQMH